MSTCGGTVTTSRTTLGKIARQIVGSLESRTRVTIIADETNDGAVYVVAGQSVPYSQGLRLAPGAAYTFDDRGARVALWAIGPHGGDKAVSVVTEGA